MANQFNQNLVFNGLGTFTLLTAPFAGLFSIQGNITLPMQTGSGQSQVVATVKQNGSDVVVGLAGASGFATQITCAAADVITVVLASSAAPDAGLNVIKTTVAVSYI